MKVNYFHLLETIIESEDSPDLGVYSDKELMKLLKSASSNRVLYLLCKRIRERHYLGMKGRMPSLIGKIITKGEGIMEGYSVLLRKIKEEFQKKSISFLIVKTDRKVDYILADIDILIEDAKFNKAQLLLAEMAVSKSINDKEERWQYVFDGQLKVDIHKMESDWYSNNFLDADSIWNDTEERQFLGDIYRFPSGQNEWIFNVLNIIYEKYSLTYLDLLYFKKVKNINYLEINKIAKEHFWDNGLRILNRYLSRSSQEIRLPLMFSFVDFFRIFTSRLFRFRKEIRLSLYFFLYYFYCKARYYLSGGYRTSFVGRWFEF